MTTLVPVRDWSCPLHDYPERGYECDECGCECATHDDVGCLGCRYGRWIDRLDEGGRIVMREQSPFVDMLLMLPPPESSPFPEWLLGGGSFSDVKVNWIEDSLSHGD